MKDKIITFLIGLLLGAIISTGSIYVYTLANNNGQNSMQTPGGMDNNQNGAPNMQAPGEGTQNETSTQSN